MYIHVPVTKLGASTCSYRCIHIYTCTCRLMRRRIKVADPRIFLIYAAYMHIREEVVDEYHYEHTAVRNVSGIRIVLDCYIVATAQSSR